MSPFAHQRLAPAARARLLADVVERCERGDARAPVVVFDLDGTLMDNRPRVVAILRELAAEWRERHDDAARSLERVSIEEMRYGLIDNLRALGVGEHLAEEGLAFWQRRFFTDGYLLHDVEVPGAVPFVRACYDAGAIIVYLTGRDLPNMACGTFASLRDLGFPIGVIGTELVTKPEFDMPDTDFKKKVAGGLSRLGRVEAVFDNEASNCNALLEAFPSCLSVLVDTLHAPDPPALLEGVRVIDHFGP